MRALVLALGALSGLLVGLSALRAEPITDETPIEQVPPSVEDGSTDSTTVDEFDPSDPPNEGDPLNDEVNPDDVKRGDGEDGAGDNPDLEGNVEFDPNPESDPTTGTDGQIYTTTGGEISTQHVPEPGTLVLFGSGLAVLGFAAWRRSRPSTSRA